MKTLYYLQKEDFLHINIAKSSSSLSNQMKKSLDPEEPDIHMFSKLKDVYGAKGEFLITTVTLFELKPKWIKAKMHVSNLNLYFTNKGQLYSLISISTIFGCYLLHNHLEFVIKTTKGDILLIHNQAYAILKEIIEIIKTEINRKLRIKVAEYDEIKFRGIVHIR